MTPAVTETVPQESGVHFSSPLGLMSPSVEANLCLDNSKSMQCSDPLDSCSSGLIYTGNDLCLQKDYTNSEGGCPLSPQYEFFVSSSGINVDRKHSSIWKAEKDADRQSFCTRAGVRPHFAERNVKRKLFPGSVSQVLADVNKLWDLSVTETEGMSGSPKYRLNGRIEGESLAVPLACHYSSLEVTDLEKEPQKMPNKKSEVRSTFQRCLYRQQALRTRAQRNKKRLELLLANHVVEHCSQQISGFVKDQIKKRKSDISPAFRRSNDSETDHSALDSSRMDLYGGNSQTKDLKPVVQDFCIRMTNKLKSVEQDLDSDATGSSSDEDWEEIARKSHEWKENYSLSALRVTGAEGREPKGRAFLWSPLDNVAASVWDPSSPLLLRIGGRASAYLHIGLQHSKSFTAIKNCINLSSSLHVKGSLLPYRPITLCYQHSCW